MQDSQNPNPNKLFVGNLSFQTTEEEIVELFSQHGELEEVKLIIDRATGNSRGIAFVTFKETKSAEDAKEALNGFEFGSRQIVVNVAKPRAPRRDFGGGGRGNYGGDRRDNRSNNRY